MECVTCDGKGVIPKPEPVIKREGLPRGADPDSYEEVKRSEVDCRSECQNLFCTGGFVAEDVPTLRTMLKLGGVAFMSLGAWAGGRSWPFNDKTYERQALRSCPQCKGTARCQDCNGLGSYTVIEYGGRRTRVESAGREQDKGTPADLQAPEAVVARQGDQLPPGWYLDSYDRRSWRWWNGQAWTTKQPPS